MPQNYIPYNRQNINQSDIDAVVDVLRSSWITQGPTIERFENALSEYCSADYAIAVANGTAALHLACLALGLTSGDILWTSPITFVASANCALYCGARVDFVDIDPLTGNMSVSALKSKLEQAAKKNQLPKIVIPVHFTGQSCDMKAIKTLADKYKFFVIEDASHALGGKYQGKKIGSCEYSSITIFSFHAIKSITSAEGGALLTRDKLLAKKLKQLRTHGITHTKEDFYLNTEDDWYYELQYLGFNYRFTDIQAALGITQLSRLDSFIEARRNCAKRYDEMLVDLPLKTLQRFEEASSAWHLYVILVDAALRSYVFKKLRAENIGVNVHYIPVHLQPYYKKLGFKQGDYPYAEAYYQQAISLPLYVNLTEKEQNKVVSILSAALQ